MKTTKTTQAAETYLNSHLKKSKPVGKQLSIEIKKTKKPFSPNYDFTTEKHYQIIDRIEIYRKANKLDSSVISRNAGYAGCTYSNLRNSVGRFSKKSYTNFMALISTPVQNKESELTAQKCIDFLKATGKYKISKLETITNWIEL
jgi:hypothetical protein